MRFAVDSNVLVYALVRADREKHRVASELMIRGMLLDMVLPAQVIGEFLNVMRRKHPVHFDAARAQATRWEVTCPLIETRGEHVLRGADFAAKHRLQLWDSVIWQVVRSARATLFLSEDLQDGLSIEGLTVLNPFEPANEPKLRDLLGAGPLEAL